MLKRCMDIVFSIIGLVILSPVLIVVGILIYFKLGSPILFRQDRVGLKGKKFRITKFRTMLDLADSNGFQLPDENRLTPFGAMLRATSLDELPELWNVVKGEMSLVGPRPLPVEYLPLYSAYQARRHNVRPGVTGVAQINGRNDISWDQKFNLDVWYVDNRSVFLDIRIIFLTVFKVIKREGIAAKGSVSAHDFKGN